MLAFVSSAPRTFGVVWRLGDDVTELMIEERDTDAVVFRSDLYPRIETSQATVQKYATDLAVLPPIEVNQRNEIIDGWHRWTAHRKANEKRIRVTVTPTASDAELLELAIERNAAHGLQLSQEDKQSMARRIYHVTPERERDEKKRTLARILSVSPRTVRDWLSRIDKDTRDARDRRILADWLACYTQEEIAQAVGCDQDTVSEIVRKTAELPESVKPAATHLVDFDAPLYNVWRFVKKSGDVAHPGNTEQRILDNLLYLYTQPLDIVIDPFAGSGTTINVCKKRWRRYWVSDRKPVVDRADVRTHDLTEGVPKPPSWEQTRLIYLDPPYWKQAEGEYSTDPTDLANMSLDDFTRTLTGIVNGFAAKLHDGAHIALIIQPTQWRAPERQFTDHIADLLRRVKLPIETRIQVPYETQQCTAQMVEWAKANRQLLVLSREIIVWRVAK